MRVTVFGATGATGRHVVAGALAAGHDVTVLVRDPGKLGPEADRLRVVVGDARDPDAVAEAVTHARGVVSSIGGTGLGRSTMITDCMTTIVASLSTGTRLLAVSTVGAGNSGSQMAWPVRIGLGLLLRNAIRDHNGQERMIRTSDLDWTIARCVGLTDEPPTGQVHVLTEGRLQGSRIARADVADWLVAQLQDHTYSRAAVSLW